jgi:putative ABC transport system permease protein
MNRDAANLEVHATAVFPACAALGAAVSAARLVCDSMASLLIFFRMMVRPLTREPVRTALTLFAVALGVAVVVAIELAGAAATGSFRSSLESLTGEAEYEITAVGGLDETLLGQLASLPYAIRFAPLIEGFAVVEPEHENVPAFGVDMLDASTLGDSIDQEGFSLDDLQSGDSLWVGKAFGKSVGDTLRLTINARTQDYIVRGAVHTERFQGAAQDNVVVMDIATAQRVFDKQGRLDRIAVLLPKRDSEQDWEGLLSAELPAGVTLSPRGTRTEQNRKMLGAFRWNLRILSYISLVVGAFLIYNTISVSVVRRRLEIGVMRALGATRGGVLLAFLAEAAFFGTAGMLLGLAVGRVMADGAVQLMAATVETLYVSSAPGPIETTFGTWVIAAAAGIGVSLVSALAPAREAARVSPSEAMARGHHEYHARLNAHRDLAWAGLLALGAGLASLAPPIERKPLFGYLAALLLIAAAALAIPAVVAWVTRLASAAAGRVFGVEGFLASRSLAASLPRTSVLVGALSTAVAMMVSVGVMVGSFRETVQVWMEYQLRADLYIRPAGNPSADRLATMEAELADRIAALPAVDAVDRFRSYPISYNGLPATLGAGEAKVVSRSGMVRFLEGPGREVILEEMRSGDNAIISEPFSAKHDLHLGDTIRLPLGGRETEFRVAGVYYDYSSERGVIIVDRSTLLKYLPDPALTSLAVYLKPGEDLEAARAALEKTTAGHRLFIASNRTLRQGAIRVFDRTFAITYALEAVAIVVAIVGMAGALLALVIDRRREIGVLRFLGASREQVRRLILVESGLLGLLSNLVGMALGTLLSLVLIYVINKQSFGWTIQFHWPVALLVAALTLIYAATLLAGIYPARMAARLNPIEVVHEE